MFEAIAFYLFAFLTTLMFFDTTREVKEKQGNKYIVAGLSIIAAVLVVLIFAAPMVTDNITALYPMTEGVGNTQDVGMVLFTKYLVPFEVAAVMLLVAMIAGIVLAGKSMDESMTLSDEVDATENEDTRILS